MAKTVYGGAAHSRQLQPTITVLVDGRLGAEGGGEDVEFDGELVAAKGVPCYSHHRLPCSTSACQTMKLSDITCRHAGRGVLGTTNPSEGTTPGKSNTGTTTP